MSIATVEIRAFSGPDLVELGSANRPAIIRLNVGPAGPAGPNSVTSATTTNFTSGQVLYANSGNVGSLSRSGIDTRTTFPNDDVTAATSDGYNNPGKLLKTDTPNGFITVGGFSILGADSSATSDISSLTGDRVYTFPDADGTFALTSDIPPQEVKSANFTAADKGAYITVATLTVTDPSPSEGASFSILVRNGTATVGGTAYAVAGTLISRVFHSGAWANYVYDTIDGVATLTNKTLTNPTVNNFTEGVVSIGNSGTSQTLALTNGTFQTVTLTGNCTFTMPTATAGKSFILKVLTGAGGFTATFTGVKWPSSATPTITTTASRYDLVSFIADGTAWSGSVLQNFTP
jgi:hypothetical protein